ncbi:basic proline-rich protein-like [Moschus berezovskii]|uniref:basic proline-rich protein-like n=1 Tax=Moschus berezovskii TaxID=68408 RepID=UPI0024449198|nr:basic proline-rich protein-like [Moschus berezovskii]
MKTERCPPAGPSNPGRKAGQGPARQPTCTADGHSPPGQDPTLSLPPLTVSARQAAEMPLFRVPSAPGGPQTPFHVPPPSPGVPAARAALPSTAQGSTRPGPGPHPQTDAPESPWHPARSAGSTWRRCAGEGPGTRSAPAGKPARRPVTLTPPGAREPPLPPAPPPPRGCNGGGALAPGEPAPPRPAPPRPQESRPRPVPRPAPGDPAPPRTAPKRAGPPPREPALPLYRAPPPGEPALPAPPRPPPGELAGPALPPQYREPALPCPAPEPAPPRHGPRPPLTSPLPQESRPALPLTAPRPQERRPRPGPAPRRVGPAPTAPRPGRAGPAQNAPRPPEGRPPPSAPPPRPRARPGRAALSSRARAPEPPRHPDGPGPQPSARPPPPRSDTSARGGGGGGRAESWDRSLRGSAFLAESRTAFSPTGSLDQDACKARGRGLQGAEKPVLAPDRPSRPRAHTLPPGGIPARGTAGHTARWLGGSSGRGPAARGAGTSWAWFLDVTPETRAPPPAAPNPPVPRAPSVPLRGPQPHAEPAGSAGPGRVRGRPRAGRRASSHERKT